MNLTNEQIEAILDRAPVGFTHIDLDDDEYEIYGQGAKNLYDLKEILTLRQENERLKAQQVEVAARAVEDAIASCKSKEKYALPLVETTELYEYANQLRKGARR